MPALHVYVSDSFEGSMDALRREAFPDEECAGSSRDEYDGASLHLGVDCDGGLAAYGRLTPSSQGYFRSKFGPATPLPDPAISLDMGRIAVSAGHRGRWLSELVLLEGFLRSHAAGYAYIVGSSRPDSPFRRILHEVGMVDAGPPVTSQYNALALVLQPLVVSVEDHAAQWQERMDTLGNRFLDSGYTIHRPTAALTPAPTPSPRPRIR